MDAVTTDYPFPGCCGHTFNAHDKTHCLVCDCAKQTAVQVGPSEEPEPIELQVCGVCHAAVLSAEDREAHADWHERQLNTLSAILTVLQSLTGKTLPTEKPDAQ